MTPEHNSSRLQNDPRDAKSQRDTERGLARAYDFWIARKAGQRLSAHELRCHECGELSEAPVCALCTETLLQSEIHQ